MRLFWLLSLWWLHNKRYEKNPLFLLSSEATVHQSPGAPTLGLFPEHFIHCPHLQQHKETSTSPAIFPPDSSLYCPSTLSLGTNFSELLNIQKRDCPLPGPSFTNSWPSPFPHFPHRTLYAPGLSSCLDTLSSWMVSVKAGQGDECSYLERLENSWWSHLEHIYIPGLKWSLKTSPPKNLQNDIFLRLD